MKKFFIKSSNDLIKRELEKLQTKVNILESSVVTEKNPKRKKRTAVYSPPVEVEANLVEFEADDEMFTVKNKTDLS